MSPDLQRRLYRDMVLIRRVEEAIADRYSQQQMRCPTHLCIGQEAAPVGVCAALAASDYVFSTHRSHGHYLAKGGRLVGLLGELYGREVGCSMGKGGSMHMIDLSANFLGAAPILGATIALAVGAAFGTSRRKEPHVAVAFFGDAAIEEGTFYEAANFALLHRLPVVLVCENNGLSTCSPLSVRQPEGRLPWQIARGLGLHAAHGDGNDVAAVYRLAQEAVEKARSGGGPAFLEFATYRWREHCGPNYDFHLGYRTEAEVNEWKERCPIERLRQEMIDAGTWEAPAMQQLKQEVDREIEEAFRVVQTSRYPAADLMMAHEYAP